MAYTADFSLALGPANTGIADLRAQLVDTAGVSVGGAVSTLFTEIGTGFYLWHYTAFPDGHRGGVKFYSNAAPATILAFTAINPEELENVNAKLSTLSASAATAIDGTVVSGVYTYGDIMRLMAATQGGDVTGAETGTVSIGDISATKTAVIATIDANHNRDVTALDLTP